MSYLPNFIPALVTVDAVKYILSGSNSNDVVAGEIKSVVARMDDGDLRLPELRRSIRLGHSNTSIIKAAKAAVKRCIDPVNSCSGVNVEGNDDEHPDGRRHQALDSQA